MNQRTRSRPSCPKCGEDNPRHVGYNPKGRFDGWQCRDCNHRWTTPKEDKSGDDDA